MYKYLSEMTALKRHENFSSYAGAFIYPATLRHRLWYCDSYTKPGLQLVGTLIMVLMSVGDSRCFAIRSASASLSARAVAFLAKITFNDSPDVIRMVTSSQQSTCFRFIFPGSKIFLLRLVKALNIDWGFAMDCKTFILSGGGDLKVA